MVQWKALNWKHIGWYTLALALLIYVFTQSYSYLESRSAYSLPLAGQIIVIDPGHGGRDGGAMSKTGLQEKEVTLAISLYLRDLLQQSGAFVVMTREEDIELSSEEAHRQGRRKVEDLTNRVKVINESDADFLVSIHLNSIASPKWRGAQTFYHPKDVVNKQLAESIQYELTRNLENTNRKAKANQDIFMLKNADIPGVLVEAGFLSNPDEAALLGQSEYQKQVALAIYTGILYYYQDTYDV